MCVLSNREIVGVHFQPYMQTRQPFTWKNTKTNSFLLEFQALHLIRSLFAIAFSLARSLTRPLALSVCSFGCLTNKLECFVLFGDETSFSLEFELIAIGIVICDSFSYG